MQDNSRFGLRRLVLFDCSNSFLDNAQVQHAERGFKRDGRVLHLFSDDTGANLLQLYDPI